MVSRSPIPFKVATNIFRSLGLSFLPGVIAAMIWHAGAIAQTLDSTSSTPETATTDIKPAPRVGQPGGPEETLDGASLPGLDLRPTLRLWEAINILGTSLEQGLDVPCRFQGAAADNHDIRQEGLTLPSLWLPQSLVGGKVVRGWYVYESVGTGEGEDSLPWVEVVINEQPWVKLDYLNQYRTLETMGRAAFRFGYRLRACNQRGQVVALYACGLDAENGTSPCRALLRGGVSARLNRNPFGF